MAPAAAVIDNSDGDREDDNYEQNVGQIKFH
jgi:hypothetical protein